MTLAATTPAKTNPDPARVPLVPSAPWHRPNRAPFLYLMANRPAPPEETDVNTPTRDQKDPDLTQGVPIAGVPDGGMLEGHVGEERVLLARRGDEVFAIGAVCSHYSGPLAEGLLVDDTVGCPWHHACFSLRTGEALRAPALSPGSLWPL